MIKGLYSENIDIDEDRFSLLFLHESKCFVLRQDKSGEPVEDSTKYNIILSSDVRGNELHELLSDMLCMKKVGKIDLKLNDVVTIGFNGSNFSFLFINDNIRNPFEPDMYFQELKGFFDKEIKSFLSSIHQKNCVIDITNKKLVHIENIVTMPTSLYALHTESFMMKKKKGFKTVYNYYIYMLNDKYEIDCINPFCRPFDRLQSVLDFFVLYSKKRNEKALVLFDKKELEMVMDYKCLCEGSL